MPNFLAKDTEKSQWRSRGRIETCAVFLGTKLQFSGQGRTPDFLGHNDINLKVVRNISIIRRLAYSHNSLVVSTALGSRHQTSCGERDYQRGGIAGEG